MFTVLDWNWLEIEIYKWENHYKEINIIYICAS